jgi:hypothetical protein
VGEFSAAACVCDSQYDLAEQIVCKTGILWRRFFFHHLYQCLTGFLARLVVFVNSVYKVAFEIQLVGNWALLPSTFQQLQQS